MTWRFQVQIHQNNVHTSNCRAENLKSFKLPYLRIVLYFWMLVAQLTIQKLFQYVQRLLGVDFEHKQIHFPQPVMVFFVASAKHFAEFPWVGMPFTWIPSRCNVHVSQWKFRLRYLLFSQRKSSRLRNHIHEWNWRLCERTHAYVCVNCQILPGENQNIWIVSSVFTSV